MRALALAYATVCYLAFLASFAYLVGFLLDLGVPRSVDVGPLVPPTEALVVDLGLLVLFGLQHSLMARASFKRVWTRVVPEAIERSTYILLTSLVLALIYWQWRPIPTTLWHLDAAVGRAGMYALFAIGLGLAAASTLAVDFGELYGFRQAGTKAAPAAVEPGPFVTGGLYGLVRHPMMLGVLLMLWATPSMSVGHLLFAVGMSAYVLIGTLFEEAALIDTFGKRYVEYCRRVPMLLPWPRPRGREGSP